jgi:cyclase
MEWAVGASSPALGFQLIAGDNRPVRLVARMDVKGKNLIKGVHLEGLRVIGSPNERARQYYSQGVDELLYIDNVASLYDRNYLGELVTDVIRDVFIPVTVAGGVRSVKDVRSLLRAGAYKVAINTAAIRSPRLITEIAESFGSQCVVVSIEAKQVSSGSWEALIEGGREKTGVDVLEWAEEAISLGAGEILLTSVDRDGTEKGFDLELVRRVGAISTVPLIASGGMGSVGHARELLLGTTADAVAMGSAAHYDRLDFRGVRKELLVEGFEVKSLV